MNWFKNHQSQTVLALFYMMKACYNIVPIDYRISLMYDIIQIWEHLKR